jgi:hypothetical protein
VDAQAGLDPCWSQIHYFGFVVMRLIYNVFTAGGDKKADAGAGGGEFSFVS